MLSQNTTGSGLHPLASSWTLWAHLPQNQDWSPISYISLSTFSTVEDALSLTEMLPSSLVENCMLFLMKGNVKPMWEDPLNRHGGSFSYKVTNKLVTKVWKDLTYCVIGETVSRHEGLQKSITGITISPKKSFCVVKIWTSSCAVQDPTWVTDEIKGLVAKGCLFKKHMAVE
jgi:hypothetical protein